MTLEESLAGLIERAVKSAVRAEFERRKDNAPDGWLSIEHAAQLADVHKNTVRRWIHAGDLPACRHGQIIRVKRADLAALLSPDREGVIDFDARALAILDRKGGS